MAKVVSKIYGDALFDAALEADRMDAFFEAAKAVAGVLRENREFGNLMAHPKIMKEEKVRIVEETFKERIPKEMTGLMALLIQKGRAPQMLSVFDYFISRVKEAKGIGTADVVTAVELDAGQKAQVEKTLLDTTGYQAFEMQYSVDPSLIGGIVIRVGDRVVDSSIRTKLEKLTRVLRKAQL